MKRIQHLLTNISRMVIHSAGKALWNYCSILLLVSFFFATAMGTTNAQCLVTYEIEKTATGEFQVSMVSDTFFNSFTSPPENLIATMQVTLRVPTGGFVVSNFTDIAHPGSNIHWRPDSYINLNNTGHDYISFGLTIPTTNIPFNKGQKVPLFKFTNGGICTGGLIELMENSDPLHPNNNPTTTANIGQQLTVAGLQMPDADICVTGSGAQDCVETCLIEYEIMKRSDGRFQVNMIPQVTYDGTNENLVSTMQVVVKVHTETFDLINLRDLVHNPNTTGLWDTTYYRQPRENPNYDYIAFGLISNTDQISFTAGVPVPLFTFENGADCANSVVQLISNQDPFYPPNVSSSNSGQQLTVAGYTKPDIPICVSGSGVQDCTTNCFLSCNDDVQVSLGINCSAEILPDMIATALNLTCPGGTKTIEIRALDNTLIPSSPIVNESHINQVFNVSVIDNFTGNSCWGTIIVKDKTSPQVDCSDITDVVLDCSENLDPTNPLVGYPTVTDNCLDVVPSITYKDEITSSLCMGSFTAVVNRIWTADDGNEHGAVGTCNQRIYLRRLPMDAVQFPIDRDGIDASVLPCTGADIDPLLTGVPTLNGQSIYPSFDDLCEINVGFQDQQATTCGGSTHILRTWTVVNSCDGAFRTYIQTIKLVDEQAPTIVCISDTLQFNTKAHDCTASVSLPPVAVSDVCSSVSVQMTTPLGIVNSNGGIVEGLSQGLHEITYLATDACGNTASCTVVIEIKDVDGPAAVCNNSQVAIGPSGWVDVQASTFDDGSYDDCCDTVSFTVKRVDQEGDFDFEASFSCTDIGQSIQVILQVKDCFDNLSQCTAMIEVINDNSANNVLCPPNLTIACQTDYSDLNLFGAPTLLDNCGEPSFQVENIFNLDSCKAGTITRNFSIINAGVTSGNCTQTITVENESTFDDGSIVWPHDYLSLACGEEALTPDALPYGFNQPTYEVTGTCNNIFIKYTDSNFDTDLPAAGCYEIHRYWEVIDWCNYNPDKPTEGGIYTHTQIISIVNNVAPTITCPADVTVELTPDACTSFINIIGTGIDDCTPSNLLKYTYSIDLLSDNTEDLAGATNIASGNYSTGVHKVDFTVMDDCGNANNCSYSFTIVDNVPPIANCLFPNLVIIPESGGFAAIPDPAIIGQNSTDNCNPFEELDLKVSPAFFTCEEIGNNTITLTVTDVSGNVASCNGQINVVDANSLCPKNKTAINISGNITDEKGAVLEQVMVSIDHNGITPAMTNEHGVFQLDSLPVGLDYTIFPSRNDNHLNGISTYDLVVLNRHILGVQYINSPYKLIAADVNRSGTITTYDLVTLRKLILRLATEFPNNTSWRFVMKDFTFDDPQNPLAEYFPEVYTINNAPGNDMHIGGFVAIKIGDLNTSASTSNFSTPTENRQTSTPWELQIKDRLVQEGSIVEIPIKANNMAQILGYQFALHVDPSLLEVIEILPGELPNMTDENFGSSTDNRGTITTSWNRSLIPEQRIEQPVLFTIKAKVKATSNITEAIQLEEDYLKAEAYLAQEDRALSILAIQLNTEKKIVQLYQNRPNPFQVATTIGFELAKDQEATIKIISLEGQIVKRIQAYYNAGYQEVSIRSADLPSKGLYYYQLETTEAIETRKMLVIE